jgi:hypothetical protein
MKFYLMETDSSQVGMFPQAVVKVHYLVNHPNAIWALSYGTSVDNLIVPEKLNLVNKALWTDLLGIAMINFPFMVVSQRFWEKIQTMRLPPNAKGFPITVERRDKQMPYYVVWLGYPMYDYIDFTLSKIVLKKLFRFEGEVKITEEPILNIKNADDFISHFNSALLDGSGAVVCTNPILKKEGIQHDIFFTGRGTVIAQYIVSQQFVDAMAEENLTGVKFTEYQ